MFFFFFSGVTWSIYPHFLSGTSLHRSDFLGLKLNLKFMGPGIQEDNLRLLRKATVSPDCMARRVQSSRLHLCWSDRRQCNHIFSVSHGLSLSFAVNPFSFFFFDRYDEVMDMNFSWDKDTGFGFLMLRINDQLSWLLSTLIVPSVRIFISSLR